MKKDNSKTGPDWADAELKKFADSLETKRQKAIKYLGNNWILKGGSYNPNTKVLGIK